MDKNNFLVLDTPFLAWPEVEIPAKRFRLLLAADARQVTNESIAHFAFEALKRGMVYFCAWGPDCERVHDTFDGVSLEDYLGERRFSLPGEEDTIMTTWHAEESLEDAVDFFCKLLAANEWLRRGKQILGGHLGRQRVLGRNDQGTTALNWVPPSPQLMKVRRILPAKPESVH